MQTRIALGLLFALVAAVEIPASADDLATAKALLLKSEQTLQAAHSATAEVTTIETTNKTVRKVGSAKLLKPNYLRYELWTIPAGKTTVTQSQTSPHDIIISDGKNLWESVEGDVTQIQSRRISATGVELSRLSNLLWSDFYGGTGSNGVDQMMSMVKSPIIKTEHWHGALYTVIESKLNVDGAPKALGNYTIKMYIGPDDLLDRAVMKAGKFSYELSMMNVRVNPPITAAAFAFRKPVYASVEQSHIDPRAIALLSKVDATMKTIDAVAATVHTETGIPAEQNGQLTRTTTESVFKLMRPNYAYVEILASKNDDKPPFDQPVSTVISDGSTLWTIAADQKSYTKKDASDASWQLMTEMLSGPLADFFTQRWADLASGISPLPTTVTYHAGQQWQGARYQVVEIDQTYSQGKESMKARQTLYVGADNLVHRLIRRNVVNGKLLSDIDSYLVSLDTAPKLAKADFSFTPTADMKEAKGDDEDQGPAEKPLLANGTTAPDFTVHDRVGNPVKLSDYKGHVVVLDFWATWCGPCQQSLPSTNTVARKYRKKDVVVLGVNVWDTPDAFKSWLPEHKSYDAIKFAIDPSEGGKDVASTLYNVTGIPTQYVIDRAGKIVWSTAGFSGSDDDLIAAVEKALKQE